MVEALLPGSSLRPLLADVSAAGPVALMQVEVDPQGETPAKERAHGPVRGNKIFVCVEIGAVEKKRQNL